MGTEGAFPILESNSTENTEISNTDKPERNVNKPEINANGPKTNANSQKQMQMNQFTNPLQF